MDGVITLSDAAFNELQQGSIPFIERQVEVKNFLQNFSDEGTWHETHLHHLQGKALDVPVKA